MTRTVELDVAQATLSELIFPFITVILWTV